MQNLFSTHAKHATAEAQKICQSHSNPHWYIYW